MLAIIDDILAAKSIPHTFDVSQSSLLTGAHIGITETVVLGRHRIHDKGRRKKENTHNIKKEGVKKVKRCQTAPKR